MTLTQLRYLVALADHQHFGKAADACAISQPTLSAQLQKLETELQAALIERTSGRPDRTRLHNQPHPIRPNGCQSSAGHPQRSRRDREYRPTRRTPIGGTAPDWDHPDALSLSVAVGVAGAQGTLPALKAQYERLDLICREAMTDAVLAALKSRELDWGIIADDPGDPALTTHPLFEEPFFAALPPAHPLAAKKRVPQSALCTERILVLGEGHCLREQTQAVCNAAIGSGNEIQATSLETLRGLVAAGQGVTLLPALARRKDETALALRPLTPAASRTVRLVSRRADPRRDEAPLIASALRAAVPKSALKAK